jgi:hypothetical protein
MVQILLVLSCPPSPFLNPLYFSVGVSTSAIKVASTRLPSPKSLVSGPTQILAQFPKQHQQSPKQQLQQVQQQTQQPVAQPSSVSQQQQPQQSALPPGIKPTIQIKQESGKWTVRALWVSFVLGLRVVSRVCLPIYLHLSTSFFSFLWFPVGNVYKCFLSYSPK